MAYRQVSTNFLDPKDKRSSLRYGQPQVSINMTKLQRSATLSNPIGNRNLLKSKLPSYTPEVSRNGPQSTRSFLEKTKSIENRNKFDQQKGNVSDLIHDFMFDEYMKNGKTVIATFGRTMDDKDDQEIYRVHRESFQDLFNIIENTRASEHHQICVKIIYYFLDELINIDEVIDQSDIQNLIERVIKMVNFGCRNQILKVFVAILENTKDKTYTKLRDDILNCIVFNSDGPSICKMSYKMMMNHCDQYFFKLAFLLKENFIMEFKVEYKKLVKVCQNYFGEFWTYAIRQNSQLLYLMSDAQGLVDTREFLLLDTPGCELKSRITTTFKTVVEFQSVYKALSSSDENLLMDLKEIVDNKLLTTYTFADGDTVEQVNVDEFQQKFQNKPKIRKLLFGRKDIKSKSLFEKILSNCMLNDGKWDKDFGEILSYIWHEFRLWEVPEIYVMENPLNKTLIEYVLETQNDAYIISFLMLTVPKEYEHIHQPLHYMMLKNSLFCDFKIKNSPEEVKIRSNVKCFIQYHLNLIDKNRKDDYENTHNLLYLFEEMCQYRPEEMGENQFFVDLFNEILSEKPEKFDGENELKLPRKHFWIGLMMIYWNYFVEFEPLDTDGNSNESQKYSIVLRSVASPEKVVLKLEGFYIPFLSILSLVIIKKEDKFMEEFPKEIMGMEKSYRQIYELENTYDSRHQQEDENEIFNFYEKYSSNFSFILLYAAIKTNQKSVIKKVFEFNNFLISIPEFPSNMKVEDIHHYTMLMFLENKYELGRGDLPKSWMPHKVMKKFLDSRITSMDNHYKVDCQFMLPYYNYDVNPEKVDDGVMMNEDYDTMNYILDDNNLRSLVTHPVMEIIIKTKLQKYDRILSWNLFFFVVTYLLPTIALVYLFHRDDYNPQDSGASNCANITQIFENLTGFMNSTEGLEGIIEGYKTMKDITEGYTTMDNLTEGSTTMDNLTEGDTTMKGITEGYTTMDNLTQGFTTMDNLTKGYTTMKGITEGYTTMDNLTEGFTTIEDIFEGSTNLEDIVAVPILETTSCPTENNSKPFINLEIGWIIFLVLFRLSFLLPREIMQWKYVDKSLKSYFKKISNWIECGLIVLPLLLLLVALKYINDNEPYQFFILVVIEALNVLLMIIATVSLYPAIKFSIYMKCLQTVFSTYLMTFFLFLPLFFGCVAMAFILFDKNLGGQIEDFHDLGNASTKYIIMYSGEIAIEPKSISGIVQIIAITVMIILIINKANLILSVVVNDVQKVMDQSKEFTMRLYAKKYVEFAEKIRIFYAVQIESNEKNLTGITKLMFKFVKLATRKYPDIHQLHTLYVEKKTGNVYVKDGTPLFDSSVFCPESFRKSELWIIGKYVEYWDRFFSNLTLDSETMDVIKEIDENRNEKKINLGGSKLIDSLLENYKLSTETCKMNWKIDDEKLVLTFPLNIKS